MRTTGQLVRGALLVALAGTACRQEAPPAAVPAAVQPVVAEAVAPVAAVRPDAVAQPEAAGLPAPWVPPQPELAADGVRDALRRAAAALAEGRLYRNADDAVPLYLAVLALRPQERAAQRGLETARRQLVASVRALLERPYEQRRALDEAAEQVAVLVRLAPDGPDAPELHRRIQAARHLLALNRSAEQALRDGDLDKAASAFAQVEVLEAGNSRAAQGRAAVESALLRRAEDAAGHADFDAALGWLQRAATLREQAPTVVDARHRIEAMRAAQLVALRDGGLRDLASAKGLKPAREKLEQALRIARPGDEAVATLRQKIDLVAHYGRFRPGQVFTDALEDGGRGPQMIVVPHGGFQMGAGYAEPGASDVERPEHYVRFDRGFAMSITEVTVAEFGRFVAATNARTRATRRGHSVVYDERSGNFVRRNGADWQAGYNGAKAPLDNPVMHVSVRDAEAYANWLSTQTGHYYRLPSEAEFEYALRAGSSGRYPWGNAGTPPPRSGNFTGSEDVSPSGRHWKNAFVGYGDGYWGAAPVASFKANAWGLHDMGGNLSEWVADCWHASYRRAPSDGAAWYNPGCRQRVVRGGNWANAPEQTRAAWRLSQDSDMTSARIGFRLVRGI
ncbi:formylglycine-generating enzyme family protein [Stenotrophomonas mori]|uniref:formylglycine-generating enzyme family protein n=1 Tax=Stenotrophomonas mori TaxID=2871096 RepID=UPI00201FF695|nr:SUMF1/EgtB/PvdO family nonheme iron enzyme [Stenotrophomonas mori]